RRTEAAGRGDRQPDEVAAVGHPRVDVEASQTEGTADREQEGPEPRGAAERGQREGVQHERGRDAERDHVGERVELHTELAGSVGETRHLAVQHVHHHRHEQRDRRLYESRLGGQDQGEEPAEQVAGGRQRAQQEDAAARLFARLVPLPPPRAAAGGVVPMSASHLSTPITDSPPRTRSPTTTFTVVPRGTIRSVREPNRISPNRSPARSGSPGWTRHTIRRATTPAICFTATRAVPPSRLTVHRSFSSDASGRYAATKRPGAYSTFFTRPAIGERLTCTSSGDRKIETRTAWPTQGSVASTTAITRPSAGASTAPGTSGGVRSGSRKNPRQAQGAHPHAHAAAHQPIQPMIHAAIASGRMKGQPSEATGIPHRDPAEAAGVLHRAGWSSTY